MSKRARSSDRDVVNVQSQGKFSNASPVKSGGEMDIKSGNESKQKRARVSDVISSSLPFQSPWTRLPSVLLEKICQHRNSCQQHKQFAMTCKSFQNAAKKPGSWHGDFDVVANTDVDFKLFKLYADDEYMLFDSHTPRFTRSTHSTDYKHTVPIATQHVKQIVKQVSTALAGVKVLRFTTEFEGRADYPEFFTDMFQYLNFKRVIELDMDNPMYIPTLYNTFIRGECKTLTNLTVSADLRGNPRYIKNTHSMLIRTLKNVSLQDTIFYEPEEDSLRKLSAFKIEKPAVLPVLETLFMKNMYMESALTSEFNLFRLDSCKRLSKLTLVNCFFQRPQDLLSVSSTLKTLVIQKDEESQVPTDEQLAQVILNTPNVTDLDIDLSDQELPISVELFSAMSELKELKKLAILNVEMENSSDFSNMSSLTSLYIHADESVNESSFPPSLTQLIWKVGDDAAVLGPHVIQGLAACDKLEYLELMNSIIPNNRECFAHLTKLNTLIFHGVVSIDTPIGGDIWKPTENEFFNGFFNLPRSLIHLELHDSFDYINDTVDKIKVEFVKSAIDCKCPIVHLTTDYTSKGVLTAMRERSQTWILPIKRWETEWSLHGQKHISIKPADLFFLRNKMTSLEQVKITYSSGKQNLEVDLFMQYLPPSVTSLEIKSLFDPNLARPEPQNPDAKNPNIDKYANIHLVQMMKAVLKLEPAKLPKLSQVKLEAIFDTSSVEIDKILSKTIKDFTGKMLQKWKTLTERVIVIIDSSDG